ncbi:MAG: helix-turn-helix domain-containing protein, partial [Candidatus Binatia bacterium]
MAEWLTLDELAAYLKRGRSTLYKMARNGQIPASKIGRSWRFDRAAIDEWLRQQSPQAPARKAS